MSEMRERREEIVEERRGEEKRGTREKSAVSPLFNLSWIWLEYLHKSIG